MEATLFKPTESLASSRRFMRLMTLVWLPFTAAWLMFLFWFGLDGVWWVMGPPGALFVLIGWLREPGRLWQGVVAAVAFIGIGFWLFAR